MIFEEWYEEHVNSIYKYIFLIVKDAPLAEDLTQETFLKAFIKQHQFKGNSEIKTWLYRIAYSTTMNISEKNIRSQLYLISSFQLKIQKPFSWNKKN